MNPTCEQLATSPDFLLFDIQPGPDLRFAHVEPESYARSAFLDARITPRPRGVYRAPLERIESSLGASALPELVIAHTSFCASTLLAQCLQSPELLVLREPRVLSSIANEFRRSPTPPEILQRAFDCGWRLMGKRYRADGRVAVKLSNFTNNLLPRIVALAPETRLVLMWGALEDFLVSILKHRDNVQPLTTFLHAFLLDDGCSPERIEDLKQLPPERQAVWVWALQILQFRRLAESRRSGVKSLHSAEFLAAPEAMVTAIERWCGMEPEPVERKRRVEGCLARGSKGEPTSGSQIRAERLALRREHDAIIRDTLEWAAANGLPTTADFLDPLHLGLTSGVTT